ncbi:MAG: dihydrodipicolinate synthase family protein [Actinobacteria bacterium]|nr:dihydrodipicolinate synthase family protein [Actinomycetota bacterium]
MTGSRVLGVCPVVETPFTDDGDVDFDSFGRLLDHLVGTGVRSVMYPGFASEFYKLTEDERTSLRDLVIDRFRDVPEAVVVASVSDHSTRVAVERARSAVERGAQMINILPPHLHGPSPAHIVAHVRAILSAIAPATAILQYAPAQTGSVLTTAAIVEMARETGNLVQVKVESTPPGRLISSLQNQEPPLDSVVGYAGVQLIDALRRGAVGVQPGCSAVELYQRIWSLWHGREQAAAEQLHRRLLPYIAYWMQSIELIIAAEKLVSQRRGLIASAHCRAPAHLLDEHELAMIDRFLEEFDDFLT